MEPIFFQNFHFSDEEEMKFPFFVWNFFHVYDEKETKRIFFFSFVKMKDKSVNLFSTV